METVSVFSLIGALSAFAAAALVSWSLFAAMRRDLARGATGGAGGDSMGGVVMRALRNGVPVLCKPSRALLRQRVVERAVTDVLRWLESKGVVCPGESLLSLVLGGMLVLLVIGSLLTRTIVGGFVLDALLVAVFVVRIQAWKEREKDLIRTAVPVALGVMGDCFQSGYSLMQTMHHVSDQTEGPLSAAFGRCADALELGNTSREALVHIKSVEGVGELSFVAVALDVQHQSGGSFASVLGNAQRIVADEIDLRRSLRVQTAQARMSAQVVCLMPFVLMAVLSLMSEGFLDAFFAGPAGIALLVIALLMESLGIVLVRKMLKVAA